MSNQALLTKFYTAFQQADADAMASCYHLEATFQDPAFGKLVGADISSMWRMLIERSKGQIEITFSEPLADEKTGHVKWEAIYPFSKTGRTVHNKIDATFQFRNGLIIQHIDQFDLHQWAGMALGWKGSWFGGLGFFQNKIHKMAVKNLERWKVKNAI